jgi:DNA mismatch repair protein MSH5
VYATQCALILYMSHVGSFVPAEWAKKGITDKILTRLVTDDSISRRQSSFLRDLQDLSLFFKQLHLGVW